MFSANRRIDDHILECGRRYQGLLSTIDRNAEHVRSEFQESRTDRDRMHSENGVAIKELRALIWKFGFTIIVVLLGLAYSQHI